MYRATKRKITVPEEGRLDPIRITDDVYFVGTYQASVHLIDTGDGLILIDTGYDNTFELVKESIARAGFDVKDVRYIINTHWHGDHTEASGKMASLSGAENVISRIDAPEVEARGYFKPDVLIDDGDTLTLGDKTISFMVTPGHTKGTLSLFFYSTSGGKTYRVGMFGGAGANTLVSSHWSYYPTCRADYINSCDRLFGEKVDVFIGNHCWNNDTERKGKILAEEGKNLFIDGDEWQKYISFCKARCLALPLE